MKDRDPFEKGSSAQEKSERSRVREEQADGVRLIVNCLELERVEVEMRVGLGFLDVFGGKDLGNPELLVVEVLEGRLKGNGLPVENVVASVFVGPEHLL